MNRRLLSGLLTLLTILIADLILNILQRAVLSRYPDWPSEYVTLLGMGLAVILFMGLIGLINRISETLLTKTTSTAAVITSRLPGSGIAASLLVALAILAGLYAGFHYVWFSRLPSLNTLSRALGL